MPKRPKEQPETAGSGGQSARLHSARLQSRRRFLREMAAAGAGLFAAAAGVGCAANVIAQEPAAYRTSTPYRALASPQAPQEGTAEPVAEGSISLEEFLQFSSLLTGVANLDPALGRIYLSALQAGGAEGPSLAEVYSAASSESGALPGDVQALSGAGFFDQEGQAGLADQIINMWYSGVYMLDDEPQVATFVDALAWKVLHFTKPPTICGEFGFWAQEPLVELSPTIQFTPAPTQPGEGG
jgi:hypothetical protein